mgnify:CR=1 FL=1
MKYDLPERVQKDICSFARKHSVTKVILFGSRARGDNTERSDVDIAVLKLDLKDAFALLQAKEFLRDALQKPVDIGTFRSMKTFIKNRIQKDFIYV